MKIKIILSLMLVLGISKFAFAASEDSKNEAEAPCCEKNLQSTVAQEKSDAEVEAEANRLFGKVDKDKTGKGRTTQ